ncbi:23841_t:CDS:1 [Cetraspora pellucida]|uniref:23841_t:CDS:1 n=1 Tax=Cetraspora pellucida TaxID=1433469 RepID=A0A9N9NUG0_9GLOM|nr:23841_t:CDS:1 [Cetraspora pellucida]
MKFKLKLLKEINLKFLAKITKLRKKYAEVKVKNIEVKAKNAKLKYALEEHKARFMNLKQRNKEKTNLIAKLDNNIKKIKQEKIAINLSVQDDISILKSSINSVTF